MNKDELIKQVAELIKFKLPGIVTKEELMNCYMHEIETTGLMKADITTNNLIEAALITGKQVRGKSKLEVNVPIQEQYLYIRQGHIATTNKEGVKEKILANKDSIVKSYEGGVSTKDIAKSYGCKESTMYSYIKRFGAKMRKSGKRKVLK